MKTDSFKEKGLRKLVGLHADEAYDYVCGTYLSAQWAIRDLALRHGLTEPEVEEDIKAGLVVLPPYLSEPAYEPLEKENFCIFSEGWETLTLKNGVRVKTNALRDVWELCDGDYAGEQHFTIRAAHRETERAGKRMPTSDEWIEMIHAVNPEIDEGGKWKDDTSVRETLGLGLAGYHHAFSYEHAYQGKYGFYWASEANGNKGRYVLLTSTQVIPARNAVQANGLSVRCLAA